MENKVFLKSELTEIIKTKLSEQDQLLQKICNVAGNRDNSYYFDYLRGVYFIKEWFTAHRHELDQDILAEVKHVVTKQTEELTRHEQFLERTLNRAIR